MTKYIKDPIHGIIEFEKDTYKLFLDLINTKEFIRLSRITQLAGSVKSFPGATHTRYLHSLGAYEVSRKIVSLFDFDQQKKIEIMIAALLHDIGHGPYSHAFETFYESFDHEKMGIEIITNENSEINKVLKKHNINVSNVAKIIKKETEYKWQKQIVSSQIDCDRIDYLLRDSHFTGTSYGFIDYHILLRWLKLVNNEIVYDKRSIYWIENFLLARYHMWMQVYQNRHGVAFELIISLILKRISDLMLNNFQFIDKNNLLSLLTPLIYNKKIQLDEFQKLDDQSFYAIFSSLEFENDQTLQMLIKNYLNNVPDFECIEFSKFNYENLEIYKKWLKKHNLDFNYNFSEYKSIFKSYNINLEDEIKILNSDKKIQNFSELSSTFNINILRDKTYNDTNNICIHYLLIRKDFLKEINYE